MKLQRTLAEAEMSAACFDLGGPPRVGLTFRSADGSDNPIPRAASPLVELALTCPGLYYFTTSWLPDAENYRHHLLPIRAVARLRMIEWTRLQ